MSIDPYAPPADPSSPSPSGPTPPSDLNAVFSRPAANPARAPGYPPVGAAVAQRARAISTPPPWTGPSGEAFAASVYEQERRAKKSRDIAIGLILLVVGIIVTAMTYDSASREGGTYIIAWGPMVFGAIRLFKGLAS